MKGLPEGCQVKLDRAEEHLKLLYGEIRVFERNKPYRVIYEDNKQIHQRLYHVTEVSRPPPHWPGLVGDCVHNFRCALDHVAHHIVRRYRTPDKDTQFPICMTPDRYLGRARQCFGDRARQGLKAVVERVQPYHQRNPSPKLYSLWELHRLDIIDKHRQLLPAAMTNPVVFVDASLTPVEIIPGPFQGSSDVQRIQVPFGRNGRPVKVKVIPTVQIQLRDVEIEEGRPINLPLKETLNAVQDAVRHVLRELLPYCD